ncbi:MAG: sigma-70 family RNA polymerase sigma factor [Gammaproteobacteria bacterium]|nr:sigma-70 family RNA polymerase sigma factor [Gammaproteobacteria bacterium]MDX5374866.1 sigma-70 family RNA polymerase sigma factor [Gammaproteobacteria bacterium]
MNDPDRPGPAEADRTWDDPIALQNLRQDLLRFARLQLRDAVLAEDVVQDTLSAAFASRQGFRGEASLRTWTASILRNKIIDQIRQRKRDASLNLLKEEEIDVQQSGLFDQRGHWRRDCRPRDWESPEQALIDEQFWEIFELCLTALTENTARVFSMRELLGLETREIAGELGISENNCWVILHRARSRLRLCLEKSWQQER